MSTRETRTATIHVRLSPSERAHFAAVCSGHGIKMSEGLRRLARAASGLGPTIDREGRAELDELAVQTRAVGVNLNQIARVMNTGLLPPDTTLRKVLQDIAATLESYHVVFQSLCTRARRRTASALETEPT